MKSKPDVMLMMMAAFGVGLLLTLLLPMSSSDSIASPASPLQAGVIVGD